MTDVMADVTARARIAYPGRFAPDGTALQFFRGRTWEEKRLSWEARRAVEEEAAEDELEAALEVLEPSAVAEPVATPMPPRAAAVSVDVEDPFAGIPETDDDAPYAQVRGEA